MRGRIGCVFLLLLSLVSLGFGRVVVDMAGRRVQLPDTIRRVYIPAPPGMALMFALAPELMSGVVYAPQRSELKYLPHVAQTLPVLGRITAGPWPIANIETLAKNKPDVIVVWNSDRSPMDSRTLALLDKVHIPYVVMYGYQLQEYPAAIRFLGRLVGRPHRAEQLATECERILTRVARVANSIPPRQRPRVYYAEEPNGLSTECDVSTHTQVLKVLGDLNVHRCRTRNIIGLERVSLEQVMLYAPDVIITHDPIFYQKTQREPAWQQLKAVREHRVYRIPSEPLNWFDRPPSFMRFLGVEWLASQFYPRAFLIDMAQETKRFYRVFLGANLTDQDVRQILQQ